MMQKSTEHSAQKSKYLVNAALKTNLLGIPGRPVAGTSPSNTGGLSVIPGWGTKIPQASWPQKANVEQKQYCNKLNKDV